MADFSHLTKLAITEETTAEYVFDRIEGNPSIILAPADDVNKTYERERIRLSLELAKDYTKPGPRGTKVELTEDKVIKDAEADREHNRHLLAHACAKSWGVKPLDVNGNAVEFSKEEALSFFRALPREMFDPMVRFASNLFNFFDDPPLKAADGEALGNS